MTGADLSPKKIVFSCLLIFFPMSLMDYVHNGGSSPLPQAQARLKMGSNTASLGQLLLDQLS